MLPSLSIWSWWTSSLTDPRLSRWANFRPSAESLKRLAELLDRQRESNLTDAESSELDNYVRLEHSLGLAKAKAQLILAGRS